MRLSSFFAFGVMIALGCGVYNVANKYDKTEKHLRTVQNKIGGEEEAIRVLQAEWTFLTGPDRLEKISADYLHLQAVDGRQYVALASIPMRETMKSQEMQDQSGEPKIASARQAVKQAAVKAPAPKAAVPVQTAKADADDEAFRKIIAKELAPVAQHLPPAAAKPLPQLQATPVSLTAGDE